MPLFHKRSTAAVHSPSRDAAVTPELPHPVELPQIPSWVEDKYPWAIADRNEFRRFSRDLMEYMLKDRMEMTLPLRKLAGKADSIIASLSAIDAPDELPADATVEDVISAVNEIRRSLLKLSVDRTSS